MKDQKNNETSHTNHSRRTYLVGSASIAAASMVTACGGGAEEDPPEESPVMAKLDTRGLRLQATRMVPGTPLFQEPRHRGNVDAEEWHVEIAHRGSRVHEVYLDWAIDSNDATRHRMPQPGESKLLSSSPGFSSGSHHCCLDFATVFPYRAITSRAGTTRVFQDILKLIVVLSDRQSYQILQAGFVGRSQQSRRTVYTDGDKETEWLFSWLGNPHSRNWDVSVRFFKGKTYKRFQSYPVNRVYSQVQNATRHRTSENKPVVYSETIAHLPDLSRNVICGVIQDKQKGGDTLVLPNGRHTGCYELVRPALQKFSSSAERAHTRRRLERHLERVAGDISTKSNGEDIKGQLMHNELLKASLGTTSTEAFQKEGSDAVKDLQKLGNITAAPGFADNIRKLAEATVQSVDMSAMTAMARRLADSNSEAPVVLGAKAALSAQFRISASASALKNVPVLNRFSGAALRASVLLAQASRIGSKSKTYGIRNTDDGTKVAITGIIKQPFYFVEADLEVSMGLTFKDGGCRIDFVMVDPVLDVNQETWLGRQMAKGLGKALKATGLLSDVPDPNVDMVPSVANPEGAGGLAAFDGMVGLPPPNFRSRAIPDAIAARIFNAAKAAYESARKKRLKPAVWALVEFSPLRFGFYNMDGAKADFVRGWKGAVGFAYLPGAKAFTGIGLETNVGGANFMVRLFGGVDVFGVFGTSNMEDLLLKSGSLATSTGGVGGP